MSERTKFGLIGVAFAACFFLPVGSERFIDAVVAGLALVRWYAREHVLLCLVPAFFIAGAIGVFVSQGAVMRYLGPSAPQWLAYLVAAASGTLLAVCSCTVLPLFASIHRRGAGLGPAIAFLYSGPAINVLAILLTARVLGLELGVARAVGAIGFAAVVGFSMHLLFPEEKSEGRGTLDVVAAPDAPRRRPWQDALYFSAMVGVLVFANWARPAEGDASLWATVFAAKWWIAGGFLALLLVTVLAWFQRDEVVQWAESSWEFAAQILPLLLAGVLVAGFLLGDTEGRPGILPSGWIASLVGGNGPGANLFASVAGAFMYFATLTEVPILQGLIAAGMGKGPALALLLAGPALSLPNLLVLRGVLGTKKTVAYVGLVVAFSTLAGLLYGALFPASIA